MGPNSFYHTAHQLGLTSVSHLVMLLIIAGAAAVIMPLAVHRHRVNGRT
jgi:hypothetical protein